MRLDVHYRWLLVGAAVTTATAQHLLPMLFPGWDDASYWGIAVALCLAAEATLLVHELGHAVVAVVRGHRLRTITLLGLGAHLELDTRDLPQDVWISLAGPAANAILAIGLSLLARLAEPSTVASACLLAIAVINGGLTLLNLLPLPGLDGAGALRHLTCLNAGSRPASSERCRGRPGPGSWLYSGRERTTGRDYYSRPRSVVRGIS